MAKVHISYRVDDIDTPVDTVDMDAISNGPGYYAALCREYAYAGVSFTFPYKEGDWCGAASSIHLWCRKHRPDLRASSQTTPYAVIVTIHESDPDKPAAARAPYKRRPKYDWEKLKIGEKVHYMVKDRSILVASYTQWARENRPRAKFKSVKKGHGHLVTRIA